MESSRQNFIARTYRILFGAIAVFTILEIILFQTGVTEALFPILTHSWLITLGVFMLGGWLASRHAHRATTMLSQYVGLGVYILFEALIFIPILAYVTYLSDTSVLFYSIVFTLVGFGLLTLMVMQSKKDFTFLGKFLGWAGIIALLLIVASLVFGFTLGMVFSAAMVLFAGAAILYDTSNIMQHYPEDKPVAAALSLFASVALMFWYIITLVGGWD